jgi:hypothetical protein
VANPSGVMMSWSSRPGWSRQAATLAICEEVQKPSKFDKDACSLMRGFSRMADFHLVGATANCLILT